MCIQIFLNGNKKSLRLLQTQFWVLNQNNTNHTMNAKQMNQIQETVVRANEETKQGLISVHQHIDQTEANLKDHQKQQQQQKSFGFRDVGGKLMKNFFVSLSAYCKTTRTNVSSHIFCKQLLLYFSILMFYPFWGT